MFLCIERTQWAEMHLLLVELSASCNTGDTLLTVDTLMLNAGLSPTSSVAPARLMLPAKHEPGSVSWVCVVRSVPFALKSAISPFSLFFVQNLLHICKSGRATSTCALYQNTNNEWMKTKTPTPQTRLTNEWHLPWTTVCFHINEQVQIVRLTTSYQTLTLVLTVQEPFSSSFTHFLALWVWTTRVYARRSVRKRIESGWSTASLWQENCACLDKKWQNEAFMSKAMSLEENVDLFGNFTRMQSRNQV